MPETKSETRTLHFSITGAIITRIAREKLYVNNDLPGAFEAIMGATLTDQLTEAQRACIALAILDGRKEIVGTYPGDDYGIEDVPEDKRPNWNLAGHFRKMNEKMAELERKNKLLLDKLACVSETIGSENLLKRCDAEWRTNWCDKDASAEDRTIFGTEAAWGGIAAAVRDILAEDDMSPLQKAMLPQVAEFTQRMTQSEDLGPDYGWLFPDGKFEPVEFGDHLSWAMKWLKKHDPEWKNYETMMEHGHDFSDAGDVLNQKYHAVLLHNPGLGYARVTSLDLRGMTKAQKEFLYDYYKKRGLDREADDIWKED